MTVGDGGREYSESYSQAWQTVEDALDAYDKKLEKIDLDYFWGDISLEQRHERSMRALAKLLRLEMLQQFDMADVTVRPSQLSSEADLP